MTEGSDKRQTKIMFILLGFMLIPIFAEIYSWVSGLIIGGIITIIFGGKVAGFVYTIILLVSIVFSFITYFMIYKTYMKNNNIGDKNNNETT